KIVAVARGVLPNEAFIYFNHGHGFGKAEPITTSRSITDPGTGVKYREFEYEYNPVIADFSYYVAAGDDRTPVYSVRVVDRPELTGLKVSYELPAYITDAKW